MKGLLEEALNNRDNSNGKNLKERLNIYVVGAGGAGNNTIDRLSQIGIHGAELVAVNTDHQQLENTKADRRVLISEDGLGVGGDPRGGYEAVKTHKRELLQNIDNPDLVFVTAGMGGGTGTGASGLIADCIKNNFTRSDGREPLVVGVVTYPFKMEGKLRQEKASLGCKILKNNSDTLITIENDKLLEFAPDLSMDEAFNLADEIIARMVKSLTETVSHPSRVNIDYADVYSIMKNGGTALIGIGESDSNNRATDAVENAIKTKMLDVDVAGSQTGLLHFSHGPGVKLGELNSAMERIHELIDEGGNTPELIWGAREDENLGNTVRVMLIMTGVKYGKLMPNNLGGEMLEESEDKEDLEEKEIKKYIKDLKNSQNQEINRDNGFLKELKEEKSSKSNENVDLDIDHI